MPPTPEGAKPPAKIQLKVYVKPSSKATLEEYTSATGKSQSAAIEECITDVLHPELAELKDAAHG